MKTHLDRRLPVAGNAKRLASLAVGTRFFESAVADQERIRRTLRPPSAALETDADAINRADAPGRSPGSSLSSPLAISEPGDVLERAADRFADAVTARLGVDTGALDRAADDRDRVAKVLRPSGFSGPLAPLDTTAAGQILERQADAAADAVLHDGSMPVIARGSPASTIATPPHELGAGAPLRDELRADMESRFGFDFAAVRIYDDDRADVSARALGARAYTTGNHITFAADQYRPDSAAGRRLVAHELAHVVQQASGAGPSIQRDDDRQQPARSGQDTAAVLARIEADWKGLRTAIEGESIAADWIARGDEVVALLLAHTLALTGAISNRDALLSRQYVAVLETDLIAYQYISWHAALYTHLAQLRSRASSIVESFKADDRAFTGRARAEEEAITLSRFADVAQAASEIDLKLVKTNVVYQLSTTSGSVAITLTSAGDKRYRSEMETKTAEAQRLENAVSLLVVDLSNFLATAQEEGFDQAVEAVEEFYKIKQFLDIAKGGPNDGKDKSKDKSKDKDKDKKPSAEPEPVPMTPVGNEDESKPPAVMRFQVQWNSRAKDNTKGQFSEIATAPASVGVTTTQAVAALGAVHAKVSPKRARKAAAPAVTAQINWVNKRPPAGIATGGDSRSAYFEYDYPDARVDVENVRGHNLKR